MKHTSGPWEVSKSGDFVTVDNGTHAPICRMAYKGIWNWAAEVGSVENSFNAQLIAAAPDLLIACHMALAGTYDWQEVMKRAIKKAQD